ncbi:MAG TPA: DOMON domain-containing protein [Negativicutes bacterium]|nr:DOMON domain-containing protein [Negativicutes bacterium]
MRARKIAPLFVVIALLAAASGCGGQTVKNTSPAATAVAKASAEWKSDGTIGDGEYTQTHKIGDIEVFTRVEGDTVMMALRAKTKGWVALGIDPEDKMKGADIIMSSVKDGQATVLDMYSTGTFGPHPADDQQGGTNDIQAVSGSHKDGVLTVEFKRKLNTGDSKDKPLRIGDNRVIWSIGDTLDPAVKHSNRGAGVLTLSQ